MGSGIAQIAAQAGCHVVLVDSSEKALKQSQDNLDKVVARLIEKGRLTEVESDQIKPESTGRLPWKPWRPLNW